MQLLLIYPAPNRCALAIDTDTLCSQAESQAFSSIASVYQAMSEFTATVTVRLKQGVLDPEAETTQQALERLGFELGDLRSADQFEIDLDAADEDSATERVTEMTERLLANPTLHDYDIELEEQ